MHWIAPSEKDTYSATLEKHLRDAADTATRVSANPESEATRRDFRQAKDHWSANPGLKVQEYMAESEVQGAKCEVPSIRHSSFEICIGSPVEAERVALFVFNALLIASNGTDTAS